METISEEDFQEIMEDIEIISSHSPADKATENRPRTYVDEHCDSIIRRCNNVIKLTEKTREERDFLELGNYFDKAMQTARAAELLAVEARELPCIYGGFEATRRRDTMLAEIAPIELGFNERGWFIFRLAMLLPKKEKAKRDYLNGLIYPVLKQYFDRLPFPHPKFRECVIIYRHVYAYVRPKRMYRDHDNIEVNQITDALAMFVMRDDGPTLCSHYHCMARAAKNRTEVYVVPKEDFVTWLSMEPEFPEAGEELFDPPNIR